MIVVLFIDFRKAALRDALYRGGISPETLDVSRPVLRPWDKV